MNEIEKIIKNELCVGCGACTYHSSVDMKWNSNGFLEPSNIESLSTDSFKVCPFNIYPEKNVRTENEIGKLYLGTAPNYLPQVGYYYNTYVGYSNEFRSTSSSGGIATFLMKELLGQGIAQHIFSVGETQENGFYNYKVCSTKDEVLQTSKTKYYPVSMADVLKEIDSLEGKIAVVGTACFIKAIRLLQYYHPQLKEKIVFCIGIICGGQKSKFYSDYLAQKAGINGVNYLSPQYRIKKHDSFALDYSFGCKTTLGERREISMLDLGDMWGTGLFKNNACDYCDDVSSELADISLGDAWISPYKESGKGNSIIMSRSILAETLLKNGINNDDLKIKDLAVPYFTKSQSGSFNHRHLGLKYRIRKNKASLPPKRFDTFDISLAFKLVQNQRQKVRRKSLTNWVKVNNADKFNSLMNYDLFKLKLLTKIYHLKKK